MRAMVLSATANFDQNPSPLVLTEMPKPKPGRGEVLVEISVCGVCHTELDEIEGRTPPPFLPVVPGHEIVGKVVELGPGCSERAVGERVGIGWIHASTGGDDENLSDEFRATGRDVDGGYAEFIVVPETYAFPLPAQFSDAEAAPLLCAGGVGYRSLRLANIEDGQVLGLTGFGGSGHLVLQMAKHLYPDAQLYVFARSAEERQFALELGADWAGDTEEEPPAAPHAIIDTTPAWRPVLAALKCLRPGGRLVINAIRKESGDVGLMGTISYQEHLWMEKEVKSVANVTRQDIREFLPLAAAIPLHVEVQQYPLERANEALRDLRDGHVRGAKVLNISVVE
ncbi:MAG: alcohol dehydrogenase catalytic domain-containing protein [Gammaproteobacteria bacterium]|nr:alcohol dehydrogenase catalytic domain-containing protein [Gammaproteobacteria bacterium]